MANTGKKKTFTDKELRELRAEFLNAERERVRQETEDSEVRIISYASGLHGNVVLILESQPPVSRPKDGETSED